MTKIPETIFLLNTDLEMYHKRGPNVGGLEKPCINDDFSEFVMLSAVQANPAKFGIVPKAKGLEWDELNDNFWRSSTSGIRVYELDFAHDGQGGHWIIKCHEEPLPIGVERTLEAAKAAAQTHYEKLIKSALE